MSLLSSDISDALNSIREVNGTPVTYFDGTNTISIPFAGIGKTEFEIAEDGVVIETWESRDFLIPAALLQTPPANGHTITQAINSVTTTFSVMAPAGHQVFDFSDRAQTQYRIHTKKTA